MTETTFYCPLCDQHVEAAVTGDGRPFCPLCEELLPEDHREFSLGLASSVPPSADDDEGPPTADIRRPR